MNCNPNSLWNAGRKVQSFYSFNQKQKDLAYMAKVLKNENTKKCFR